MRKYLAELHRKPDNHKKRFALLASGTITLFIFGVWSLATFGTSKGDIVAVNDHAPAVSAEREISPLQSLKMSLAASFAAVQTNFKELKKGLEAVDLEAEYEEMRNSTLDIYGR